MTLSDAGKASVKWTPAATSLADMGKLAAPAKVPATRSSAFEKQVWGVTAVLQSYRMASNGEIVFQLFDIPTSTYMNAYMPAPQCLPKTARGRAQLIAARNGVHEAVPARHEPVAAARCDRQPDRCRVLQPREDDRRRSEERC